MKTKTIILIVLGILLLIPLLQNTQMVQFHFYFWHIEMPRILLLLLFFISGIIAGIYLYYRKIKLSNK